VKVRKYISKHFIIRLSMLIALISAAAVFDMYNTPDSLLVRKVTDAPKSDDTDSGKVFFCSQIPSNTLKTSVNDFVIRFRFSCSENKFLLKYYNLRTFQMMKAETVHSFFPSVSSFHSLPFNRVLYSSPDDTPPLS